MTKAFSKDLMVIPIHQGIAPQQIAKLADRLEDLDNELRKLNIQLHFSEVKGPVMDKLQRSKLLNHLSGKIFLTHYQAIRELSPDIT